MNRRLTLAVLFVIALIVAACGSPPESGESDALDAANLPECPLDALDDAEGPVTVPLWYGGLAGAARETMEEMVSRFNAAQDEVVVQATDQGAAYEEVLRSYESAAAADQLPGIVYLESNTIAQVVAGGHVLPGQSCMEAAGYDLDDLEDVPRSYYTVDDILWPGYMNTSTPVLYYNKAHWLLAGLDPDDPPTTLDEVREQAKAIKDAGVSDKPFALELQHWYYESWLNPIGVDMVNNDNGRSDAATEGTFDVDESVGLLQTLSEMNDEGILNPFAYIEGGIDHYIALATEQSSMLPATSTASTTIRDILGGDLTVEEAGADFDESTLDLTSVVPAAAPYPGIEEGGQAEIGGGAFYITSSTAPEVQAASWRFLEFMLQPENAKLWTFSGGYVPVVSSVLDEDDIQEYFSQDLAGVMIKIAYDQFQSMDPGRPGALIGPFESFKSAVGGAMESVLLSGGDPANATSSAQSEVTEALRRYQGL